ncbi:hypothetical protein DSO57_1019704 [Entomophthora muscae]|uniref:Uncharacterized protein n=1 Tax=Entomophthora muscae TaxID=34485 RepID=A0ACC2TR05_9FUNG|nr:hypothetical protein DSO57_1019704 [Entomophthora muscae]
MSFSSTSDIEVKDPHVFTTPVLPNQTHLIYGDSHTKKYKLLSLLRKRESDLSDSPIVLASSSSLNGLNKEKREFSDSDFFSESLPDEFLRENLFSLCEASKKGDLEKLEEILQILCRYQEGNLDLNSLPFPVGNTPLHIAASKGKTKIAEHLLSEKIIDIDSLDSNLETPLMKCCKSGQIQIAQLLIKNGADVNKVDFQGWTALHNASANGDLKLVSLLVEEGKALVNCQSFRGFTPLMDATARMFPNVVKYLLSQPYFPCDPTLYNSLGETAYAIAVCCEHVFLCDLLENAEKLFLSNKPNTRTEVQQVARLISVYENERYVSPGKIKGLWTSTLNFSPANLSSEYPHFSLRGTNASIQLSAVPLPTEGDSPWSWQTDWKLCTNIPKVDLATGWQYAKSFEAHDHYWTADVPANPVNCVRRRRWFRVARKTIQLI